MEHCGKRRNYVIQMLTDASSADNFRDHCDKRRNCSWWAISPFSTMISTFIKNCSFIYIELPYIFTYMFSRVVRYRYVVWGKGLKQEIIEMKPSENTKGKTIGTWIHGECQLTLTLSYIQYMCYLMPLQQSTFENIVAK